MRFRDRRHAGELLASHLAAYAGRANAVVLGLPRGGVPVAFEVARALRLPLDVFVVRKLGVPGQEELAMGAVATGGLSVVDETTLRAFDIAPTALGRVILRERAEVERREEAFRGGRPAPVLTGRTVILVDDGLATGSTMLAAVRAVRARDPAQLVVAVPVAPPDTCARIAGEVDECIALERPEAFRAVGEWYQDFTQTTDDEVRDLVAASDATFAPPGQLAAPSRARTPDAARGELRR